MDFLTIGLFILGFLPLIAYGGVLIASAMGLASNKANPRPPLHFRILNSLFLWGTLAYPVVYFSCASAAKNSNTETALLLSLMPPLYVALMALLFKLLLSLERLLSEEQRH